MAGIGADRQAARAFVGLQRQGLAGQGGGSGVFPALNGQARGAGGQAAAGGGAGEQQAPLGQIKAHQAALPGTIHVAVSAELQPAVIRSEAKGIEIANSETATAVVAVIQHRRPGKHGGAPQLGIEHPPGRITTPVHEAAIGQGPQVHHGAVQAQGQALRRPAGCGPHHQGKAAVVLDVAASGEQAAAVCTPGHRVQAAVADGTGVGRGHGLQAGAIQHRHCRAVVKSHGDAAAIGGKAGGGGILATGGGAAAQGLEAAAGASAVEPQLTVLAGGEQTAGGIKLHAVAGSAVSAIGRHLGPGPLVRGAIDADAVGTPQGGGQAAAIGREGQVVHHIRQAGEALEQAAAGAIEQVDRRPIGIGPAPQGHQGAIGAEGHRVELALSPLTQRHPQHPHQLAAGQVPDAGRSCRRRPSPPSGRPDPRRCD